MSVEREGFATRWSRKNREESQPPDAADAPDDPAAVETLDTAVHENCADVPAGSADGSTDEGSNAETVPVLTDVDMPPLESLDGDSDVSGFFSQGVSSALRQAALRRIFSSPRYNVRDGLNDYDGDYTVFEPLGDTITSDMKFHAARKEAARLAALEEEKQLEAQRLAESSSQESESESESGSEDVGEIESELSEDASTRNDVDQADATTQPDSLSDDPENPDESEQPDNPVNASENLPT